MSARRRRSLHAATADIGAAEADFFPKLTLSGSAGLQSLQFKDLAKHQMRGMYSGRAEPIDPADLRGRQAEIHVSNSANQQQQEAAVQYQQTVLQAFHDVDNALTAYSAEQLRRDRVEARRLAQSGPRARPRPAAIHPGVGDLPGRAERPSAPCSPPSSNTPTAPRRCRPTWCSCIRRSAAAGRDHFPGGRPARRRRIYSQTNGFRPVRAVSVRSKHSVSYFPAFSRPHAYRRVLDREDDRMKFSNLRLYQKLALGFGVVIAVVAATSAVLVYEARAVTETERSERRIGCDR